MASEEDRKHRIEAEQHQHRIAREEAEQREAALFKEMEQLKEMLASLKQQIEK